MTKYVSVTEAARIKKVSRQAIYLAIRNKRLRAYDHGNKLRIYLSDLKTYDDSRYNRSALVKRNGALVFDIEKGYISIIQASEICGISIGKLYHAARTGKLKSHRTGPYWVVTIPDLMKYQEIISKTKVVKKTA